MTLAEQKVLLVGEGKAELFKLVNPERLNFSGAAKADTN